MCHMYKEGLGSERSNRQLIYGDAQIRASLRFEMRVTIIHTIKNIYIDRPVVSLSCLPTVYPILSGARLLRYRDVRKQSERATYL